MKNKLSEKKPNLRYLNVIIFNSLKSTFGASTYVVKVTVDFIIENLKLLENIDLDIIKSLILEAETNDNLGSDYDKQHWGRLLEAINRKMYSRFNSAFEGEE